MMNRIMLRTVLAAILAGLAFGATCAAQETQSVFEQKAAAARTAYDRADYNTAIQLYLELKNQGLESAELDYNLGNAEFKLGNIGRAIAYYRRALKRAPGDDDIRYNLNYARSLVKQPEDKTGVLAKLVKAILYRFSGQALVLGALGAYLFFCITIGVLIWQHGSSMVWRWISCILGVVFLFLATWASFRIISNRQVRWGVIVVEQAEARNGPGETNQVGFKVPEGREVRILGAEKDWIAIGLSQEGFKGWVKKEEIWEDE